MPLDAGADSPRSETPAQIWERANAALQEGSKLKIRDVQALIRAVEDGIPNETVRKNMIKSLNSLLARLRERR